MNVYKAIRYKRAVRKFSDEEISDEQVRKILNAGRRAQSSKNTQPWQFIAIRDRAILKELSKAGMFAGHIAGANFAVAILTPDPKKKATILFDAGQAAAYMQLAAWEMGIGSCLASVYKQDLGRQILGFPDKWHLNVAISFGYAAKEESITAKPGRRGRKALKRSVHWDRW
jgi:nitroreductase